MARSTSQIWTSLPIAEDHALEKCGDWPENGLQFSTRDLCSSHMIMQPLN